MRELADSGQIRSWFGLPVCAVLQDGSFYCGTIDEITDGEMVLRVFKPKRQKRTPERIAKKGAPNRIVKKGAGHANVASSKDKAGISGFGGQGGFPFGQGFPWNSLGGMFGNNIMSRMGLGGGAGLMPGLGGASGLFPGLGGATGTLPGLGGATGMLPGFGGLRQAAGGFSSGLHSMGNWIRLGLNAISFIFPLFGGGFFL